MTTRYQIEIKNRRWSVAETFNNKESGRASFERYIETADRPIRFVISRPRAKDGKIEELILREVKKPQKLREERRKVNEPHDADVERLRERRGEPGGAGAAAGAATAGRQGKSRPEVSLGDMIFRMWDSKSDLPPVWTLPIQDLILVLVLRACLIGGIAGTVFAAVVAIVATLY